jgi:hypothetical protein
VACGGEFGSSEIGGSEGIGAQSGGSQQSVFSEGNDSLYQPTPVGCRTAPCFDPGYGGASGGFGGSFPFKSSGGRASGGVGAAPRLLYESSPKHGDTPRGPISAAPQNGQAALDISIQVKPTSPRRVGIDYETGEIVVFDQTVPGKFHGHVRPWDQLTTDIQRALINSGMMDRRGRILE